MTDVVMGCFGSVLCFSATEGYCVRCPLREACAIKVEENAKVIASTLGIPVGPEFWTGERKVKKRERQMAMVISGESVEETAPTPKSPPPVAANLYEASQMEGLPVKVHQELVRWVAKGVDLEPLSRGENPFADTPGMATADMIVGAALRLGIPDRSALTEEIIANQQRTGAKVWTVGSVRSNINIVASALAACGYKIIKEGK